LAGPVWIHGKFVSSGAFCGKYAGQDASTRDDVVIDQR